MLRVALSPPWGSGGPMGVPVHEPARHRQLRFSPSCADGAAPVLAAVIQRVSMLNTETPMALVTRHLHHLFLPAPLF